MLFSFIIISHLSKDRNIVTLERSLNELTTCVLIGEHQSFEYSSLNKRQVLWGHIRESVSVYTYQDQTIAFQDKTIPLTILWNWLNMKRPFFSISVNNITTQIAHTYTHARTHVRTYARIHASTHTHTHIHTHTHTHTRTHTRTYTRYCI